MRDTGEAADLRLKPGSGLLGAAKAAVAGLDPVANGMLLAGFVLLAGPLFWDWSRGAFASGVQGHEPVIVAVSAWLIFRKRQSLAMLPDHGRPLVGGALFCFGLLMYHVGRTYDLRLALVALVVVAGALLIFFKGLAALRVVWFALFFLVFAAPLPLELVLSATGPLKTAASAAAVELLRATGYDVGRSGVVITLGQYQLLVTEACAGLQTMFTLEAMGLLYANLMNYQSAARNLLLAALAVPIAFAANVLRVLILALVTYHLGDSAGQGFLHGLAGLTLFGVALAMLIGADWALGRLFPRGRGHE
jgi:exosortase B